ncbi:ACP S-malonyltransferase [Fluoribacter gormanii]|uniref:Malonyl CoA-acyl carrier protein transacylase n=1 Tax=Fluoribacter gormanii TaxID=464 RepID=A0A377GJF0_9GAMM|nr:ACP S-malonyltransferase [Fluoribacter gormanii]KTD00800.1 malonyl CoA-ACP transacylase [Fluoribacter gormanii]MCW8443504.1 ACP S-malonyltransferase [Fluoribacter gormanii]MCW8471932.1 ACP S-malonyltransferase [Fluoribacter gormanii]SIQ77717.1 [acyl-carrier-protein] S-malonyltransferase [Fluoribacter gormanii]STO24947.1 Malonyl CoA-acyl carrier protein transacylase [Fluoribacter gormanii]
MVKTAFVFPGQGSQSVGMLADFELQYPIVVKTFAEASEAVGYDLWKLVQHGPEEKLNQTEHTQVAMLTADVAVYRVLMEQGVAQPIIMAGHSLGEYAALVCADALSLFDAACLVARRGQVMQNAIPLGLGAMAAIVGLTDEQVKSLCEQASQENEVVTPANYNAIGQVVVAGHTPAVTRILGLAEEAGARLAKVIPVSVPCHCPLLSEAAASFAEYLTKIEFKNTKTDVVSNVDLSIYHSVQHIREKLKEQLYSPVRWVETIQLFKNNGIELILECGPGKVLGGLIKRIDRSLTTISVYDTISLDQVEEQFA